MRIEMWSLAGLRSSETAHNFAIRIDLQNAAGDSVGHIKGAVWGQYQAKWTPKLPLPQKPAIPVEDLDARILSVPDNVRGMIEMPHVVSGNPHPSQSKQPPPFRAKLKKHLQAAVGGPDVV